MLRSGAKEGRPVSRVRAGLRTSDERRAELRSARAQKKTGGNAGSVHDAARCKYRDIESPYQQACEGQGSQTIVACLGIEHAAMTSRFKALRDDPVDPGAGDDFRLTQI